MPNDLTGIFMIKSLSNRSSYKLVTTTEHFNPAFIGEKHVLPFIHAPPKLFLNINITYQRFLVCHSTK